MKKQTHYWDVMRKDGEACQRLALGLVQRMDAPASHPNFNTEFEAELAKRGVQIGEFGLAVA